MPPESLPRRTHEAYTVIKRRIIELALPPGASFSEGELAEELGFSKTPVREALARLRHERLVEATARSGYRVTPVTAKAAHDLFHLCTLLEAEAAALAAQRRVDASALVDLERSFVAGRGPLDPSSIARYLEADTRLHVALAALSGNDALATMVQQALEHLERLLHVGLAVGARTADLVHDHGVLLDAVGAGDADAARRAVEARNRGFEEAVLDALLSSDSLLSANLAEA